MSAASEAYEYLVVGIANPFALNWVPPNTLFTTATGAPAQAGQVYPLGKTMPLPSDAGVIHPGDGGNRPAGTSSDWHHISIGVVGEAIFLGPPPDNAAAFAQNGNPSTMLKARITLSMGNSRVRRFDIDVGAGVEIDVRARAVISIEALVPDPTSLEGVPFPDALGEGGVSAFTFAVALVATVYCGCCPQGYKMPVTYSQSFFLAGGGADVTMPIVSDAREIELFASDPAEAEPAVVGEFVYVPEIVRAAIGVPAVSAPMGDVVSPPGETSTRRVIIPGNANAILLSRGAETDGTTINVVQILNV